MQQHIADEAGRKRQPTTAEVHGKVGVAKFVLKSWWLVAALTIVCSALYWLDACGPAVDVSYLRLPGAAPPVRERPLNPGFLVDTPGCRIPALEPLDAHVRRFVTEVASIECGKDRPPPLVTSNQTALLLNTSVTWRYNASSCCYRPYWRGPHGDDSFVFSKNCTVFEADVAVDEEFVKVECRSQDGRQVFKDFHAFVPRKPAVEERCAKARPPRDAVSVLVVGVDAVSRLNLHRQMPRTLALMQRLGAVEMLGYNKVGDNTFPNVVPALSGLSVDELRRVCWRTDSDFFDGCPWIWKNFSRAGYRTAFGEDAPWMGIFNYVKRGFEREPTDYYARTYQQVAENEIGHSKRLNAKLCVGSRLTIQALLGYVSKFVMAMTSVASFGFFWTTSLTHDFLNYPRLGDEHYEGFFRRHLESGALARTVVVFTSDHGMRWGEIRETYQGRLEERLPFLMFAFPRWFTERYDVALANMRRNARRLTTAFDLHETLKDLLDPGMLEEGRVRTRVSGGRGRSLFLAGADDRSCQEAGVEPHWCTCQTSETLNSTDERARLAATALVEHLNGLLRTYRECAELKLAEVRAIQRQVPASALMHSHAVTDYVVVVRTRPGDALFEATVRQRVADDTLGPLSVQGTVSRINTYGDQSACVADYHMKLYCYCRSYLAGNAAS